MPKESTAKQIHDWEMLLKTVHGGEAELAGIAPFRKALEAALAQAVSARAQQDALRAASRETTRKRNAAFNACRDAASTLRSYVKCMLGLRSEKLIRYGMKPLHNRGKSPRKPPLRCGSPH